MRMDESTNKLRRSDIVYPQLSYKISGLLFEVHNELGQYCKEKQYGDLFEKYLSRDNIKFSREFFTNFETQVGIIKGNIVDFLIEDKIIIELKAKRVIIKQDYFQLRRYLEVSGLQLGLIVNFREEYLLPKRILNPNYNNS